MSLFGIWIQLENDAGWYDSRVKMLALYTLIKDRLEFTIDTIKGLEDKNNEDFIHFILSQGSNSETEDWLAHYKFKHKTYVYTWDVNRGISHGSNFLVEEIHNRMPQYKFDLICKVDNDVETITPNWLDRCASLARQFDILCSPLVKGLKSFPDGVPGYSTQIMGGELVRLTYHIGGLVHMAKAALHLQYQYSERLKMGVDQDRSFTQYTHQTRFYLIGYLEKLEVGHNTVDQEKKYPGYFAEKAAIWHKKAYELEGSNSGT